MSYHPGLHHRRSIRLSYDYSQPGAYFVNIIVRHRQCLFETDGTMHLNSAGEMVERLWQEIPERFLGWGIDAFVVMPMIRHGIIGKFDVGAGLVPAKTPHSTHQFKGVKNLGWPGFNRHLCQPDCYERILRDEHELKVKRQYIADNPLNWDTDQENPHL